MEVLSQDQLKLELRLLIIICESENDYASTLLQGKQEYNKVADIGALYTGNKVAGLQGCANINLLKI